MRKIRLLILITLVLNMACGTVAAKRFTVVIDAGHGGRDAGALGTFSREKDINLRTALAFGRYIENGCPDVNVIYTRKTDVFVTLHGRADIANKAKADLFISIHTNSLPSRHVARGLETYTLGMHRAADNFDVAKRENSVILVEKDYKERYQGFDPNSAESYIIFELMQDNNMQRSVEMAKLVQNNVCRTAARPNKGVKQAGFLVLRETSMPSCLIELGFISTPDEERLLNSDTHIDKMAKGIYQAFLAYKNKYDDNASKRYDIPDTPPTDSPSVTPTKKRAKETEDSKERKEVKTLTVTECDDRSTTEVKKAEDETNDRPVFKVQIFVADRVLKARDTRFKGETDAQYYKEGKLVKYTIGASTNYNEIYKLRKTVADKFPGCFIIAFKNDEKMDVNEAIREFKAKR